MQEKLNYEKNNIKNDRLFVLSWTLHKKSKNAILNILIQPINIKNDLAHEQIFGTSKRVGFFDYKHDYKHDDGYEHAV